ncbi:MAG: FtsQ-type POTRA domain-containing protein [Propionibacteriales bacterium]|nr:FtsQ-type POTRA domain-containing protein [Propionibacteriales bacterium]
MRRPAGRVSRFVTRLWQRRMVGVRALVVTLLGTILVGFGVWVLFFSTWLAVDQVKVAGASTVGDEAVVAAAGIEDGTPLVGVDIDEVRDAVEKIPAVAKASVHRSWPHTLTIHVTERKPVATIHRGGTWWRFDSEGVLYVKTPQRDPSLPIVAFQGDPHRIALHEVADVITALPADVRADVRRIMADSMDSIQLVLDNGRTVTWGSAAESDRKVQVLALLLSHPAATYDVSVPEQPTTSGHVRP